MLKPTQEISALIIKHLKGVLSPAEQQQLDVWLSASPENRALFNELTDEQQMNEVLATYTEDKKAIWSKIIEQAPELHETPVYRMRWARYAAVAAVLLLLTVGTWYYYNTRGKEPDIAKSIQSPYKNDVAAPQSNHATLTLADGKVIKLDEAGKGALAKEGVMQVMKKDEGILEYEPATGPANGREQSATENPQTTVTYNTISTGKGSRYKIVLADNSIVWLNAASSLKYPTAFTGPERIVELSGEGYFEVAKSPLPASPGGGGEKPTSTGKWPFRVKVNGMVVDVLGTHFNIQSYTNESAIKTTLLEGSVRVTATTGAQLATAGSRLLKPGQQATLSYPVQNNHSIEVGAADIEEAVAWKDDLFVYNNATIETIMREVARWYDVEVEYEGARPDDRFNTMGVPRHVPLSQLLKMLELTDKVKFAIEGKRVIVKRS
jgi:ferric-dicitrate binding protein FerR (iron transport regulator)